MAKAPKKDLTWVDVDMATLKGGTLKAYDEFKAAQKVANEKRDAFQALFIGEARKKKAIDDADTLKFGYRFGKLSVAKDKLEASKEKGGTFKL